MGIAATIKFALGLSVAQIMYLLTELLQNCLVISEMYIIFVVGQFCYGYKKARPNLRGICTYEQNYQVGLPTLLF